MHLMSPIPDPYSIRWHSVASNFAVIISVSSVRIVMPPLYCVAPNPRYGVLSLNSIRAILAFIKLVCGWFIPVERYRVAYFS
jgi:hypothetical protein